MNGKWSNGSAVVGVGGRDFSEGMAMTVLIEMTAAKADKDKRIECVIR